MTIDEAILIAANINHGVMALSLLVTICAGVSLYHSRQIRKLYAQNIAECDAVIAVFEKEVSDIRADYQSMQSHYTTHVEQTAQGIIDLKPIA
jgi:hypothetical protein